MEDVNARVTVFAPVNDVFLYNPDLRAMDQKEVLSHIGRKEGEINPNLMMERIDSGHPSGGDQRRTEVGEADPDQEHHQQRISVHHTVREWTRELCQ